MYYISKELMKDNELTSTEKLVATVVFDEISLNKVCTLKNRDIAKIVGCKDVSVSHAITTLLRRGDIKLLNFDGRTRILGN